MVVQSENDLISFVDRLWRKYQAKLEAESSKTTPNMQRIRFLLEAQVSLMDSLREWNESVTAETLSRRK